MWAPPFSGSLLRPLSVQLDESLQLLGNEALVGDLVLIQVAGHKALWAHIVEGLNGALGQQLLMQLLVDCLLERSDGIHVGPCLYQGIHDPQAVVLLCNVHWRVVSKVPAVWVSPTVECTLTTWREGNLPT